MFKRFLLAVVFVILATGALKAQKTEFGVNLFASQYFGDLRENWSDRADFGDGFDYMFNHVSPGGGAYIRYNIDPKICIKGAINYTMLKGDDADAVELFNLQRNLSFRTSVLEFSGLFEYNFRPFEVSSSAMGGSRSTPFVFAGLALYRFNPQAQYTDPNTNQNRWIDLQPLGTEGQELINYPTRSRYDLTQISIPIGVGYKFALNENWRIALEVGHRITFNDYLDDVSSTYVNNDVISANRGATAAALADRRQEFDISLPIADEGTPRGDSANKDSYLFFGISVGYTVFKGNCPTWF